jgi:hypothetical protein
MRQFWGSVVCGLALGLPAMAHADDHPPIIVELFTSQGCSSCPPADEILAELAQSDDVIPLALHVDYWDYIGWADSFANPAFTERQKRYAAQAGERTIYTPQFVIGGVDHVVGAHPMELMELMRRHIIMADGIDLDLERSGNTLSLTAESLQSFATPLVVQLVRYQPSAQVDIERGENAGKTVDYTNIVTSWDNLGEWDTRTPLSMSITIEGDAPAVVILQEPGPGLIVSAGRVR